MAILIVIFRQCFFSQKFFVLYKIPHSFIYARLADCKSHSVHDTQKNLLL